MENLQYQKADERNGAFYGHKLDFHLKNISPPPMMRRCNENPAADTGVRGNAAGMMKLY